MRSTKKKPIPNPEVEKAIENARDQLVAILAMRSKITAKLKAMETHTKNAIAALTDHKTSTASKIPAASWWSRNAGPEEVASEMQRVVGESVCQIADRTIGRTIADAAKDWIRHGEDIAIKHHGDLYE